MSLKKRLLKKTLKSVIPQHDTAEAQCVDSLSAELDAVMREHAVLNARLAQDAQLAQVLTLVQSWQKRRITQTYRRLLAHEAFGAATRFVLEEAYAGPDHDALIVEIERVVPHVVRLFPAPLVKTACNILSLNTMTLALDIELSRWLLENVSDVCKQGLNAALYEMAYCARGDFDARRRQLDLMAGLGASVEHYLGSQWVFAAFKVAKLPAKALGLHALVSFMQNGFHAIHKLPVPATELVALLVTTERGYLERLAQGERGVFAPECKAAEANSKQMLEMAKREHHCKPVAV